MRRFWEKLSTATRSDKFPFLLLAALCLPAVYALTVPGFYGASDDIHIAWVYEMVKTLKTGQVPPRFVPDLSYGFGYPLFNFVFPLPYYVGAILNFVGFSLVDSVKIIFGLSILVSSLFMFSLLKQILGKALGLAGAVMYAYAPYRAIDIYYRGDIGEATAFVFFPLILLSLYKLTTKDRFTMRWVGIGAIGIVGLILSHNIAAYMFMPVALLFVAFRLLSVRVKIGSQIGRILLTLTLGIAGAMYFWLPAILDSRLVKYDTVFSYTDNFPSVWQLFAPYLTNRLAAPDPYGGQSFYLGTGGLVALAVSLILFAILMRRINSEKRVIFYWALACLSVALFMMNFRSSFLWQHIPFLPYFQFPWRFLMMTTFLTPFLLVWVPKRTRKFVAAFLVFLSIVTTFQLFKPHDFLFRSDDYYLNRYIPIPTASEEYKLTKEEYLRLPVGTEVRPSQNYPVAYPTDRVQSFVTNGLFGATVTTTSDSQFWLSYSKYVFPGWVAYLNDKKVSIAPGEPLGQISVLVPPGINKVQIRFEETSFKKILDLLSLGAIILSMFFITRKETKFFYE